MAVEATRRSNRTPVELEASAATTGTEAPQKNKAPAGPAPRNQGVDSLVRRHDLTNAGAARAQAASGAIVDLARAVGEDPTAFARPYVGGEHANKSPAQIRAQARFDFVRDVLARRPDTADALIGARLRGADSTTQALARAAVQQSGTQGAARYAACEQALAAVAKFDADARGDVLARVRAGEPFARAVQLQKQELAKLAREAQPRAAGAGADLRQQALANASARGAAVQKLAGQVHRTLHAIGKLSRGAEFAAGVGAAAGTLGSVAFAAGESAVTRSGKPLERATHEAERAGGFVAGELTTKIRQADRTAVKLLDAAGRFETTLARHKQAIRDGDHATVLETSKQLDAILPEVQREAASLAAQAKSIGKLNADFDGAAEHAALTVLLTGVFAAVGNQPGVHHAVHGAAEHVGSRVAAVGGRLAGTAAQEVTQVGLHALPEGAAARGYGAVRH